MRHSLLRGGVKGEKKKQVAAEATPSPHAYASYSGELNGLGSESASLSIGEEGGD